MFFLFWVLGCELGLENQLDVFLSFLGAKYNAQANKEIAMQETITLSWNEGRSEVSILTI